MRLPRIAFITLALALCVAPNLGATTVVDMDLPTMAEVSPAIVHGTVISSSSRWNADRSLIVTDVRIQVNEVLKGDTPTVITVTQPGGRVDGLRVDVPGSAPYRAGTETVLFMAPTPDGSYSVAGISLGRFDVTEDARSGSRRVRSVMAGLDVDRLSPQGTGAVVDTPLPGPMDVDRFLERVRGLVAGAEGRN